MGGKKGTHSSEEYKRELATLQEHKDEIEKYIANGIFLKDILNKFDISRTNYHRIINEHPELAQLIERGQHKLILQVRNELLKKCFEHEEKTVKTYEKKDLETGHTTLYTETTSRIVKGDTGAQIFWLKNNDKEQLWVDDPSALRLKTKQFNWQKKKDIEEIGIEDDEENDDK